MSLQTRKTAGMRKSSPLGLTSLPWPPQRAASPAGSQSGKTSREVGLHDRFVPEAFSIPPGSHESAGAEGRGRAGAPQVGRRLTPTPRHRKKGGGSALSGMTGRSVTPCPRGTAAQENRGHCHTPTAHSSFPTETEQQWLNLSFSLSIYVCLKMIYFTIFMCVACMYVCVLCMY